MLLSKALYFQNLRLVANQAPSIHGDYDCVEVFPSRDSDVAISETPPLTDSQVCCAFSRLKLFL